MHNKTIPSEVAAHHGGEPRAGEQSEGASTTRGSPLAGHEPAAAQNEAMEWKERCLRLAAEFENFKKRTTRETEQRAAEQKAAFVRGLLPVVDNLERALATGPAQTVEALREGVVLTLRQMTQLLNHHGFASREDVGQPFDPQFHEAVCVRSEPTHPDHAILEVWQRGWVRGRELFRPAKVVVNDWTHRSPPGSQEKPTT